METTDPKRKAHVRFGLEAFRKLPRARDYSFGDSANAGAGSHCAHQRKDFEATIAGLNARLKEQDSKIKKVSAQLEASESVPRTVLNDR